MRSFDDAGFMRSRPPRRARLLGLAIATAALAAVAVVPVQPATAAVFDASAFPLKFKQANRVAITAGATGKTAGDILKYKAVTTIGGTVIDAVVKTVAVTNATVSRIDEGSAVSTAPPGSPSSVDDLLMTDIVGTGGEAVVTLEFTFYEGGTYTGVGSGVPATLANVSINSYDIDGNAGIKQFTDFRGFQSYTSYTASSTQGLEVQDKGSGIVRFQTLDGNTNVNATSGSYSFSRLRVEYDQVTTLTVRIGELGAAQAYYALDFSAGGMWTTNGTTAVTPTTVDNPYNAAPTTSDVTPFYVAQGTGYVFRSADFPYADADSNPFAAVTIAAPSATGSGALEFDNGSAWVPVTPGQVIPVAALDAGALRLLPDPAGGSFTFKVNDGLADSSPATLTYSAAANGQTISFASPGVQYGGGGSTIASGASSSSGLPTALTALTPGVCGTSGSSITTAPLPSGVGTATCVVAATQTGDSQYGRAAAVTRQFTVSSLSAQTLTFTSPGNRTFSTAAIATDAATTASSLTPTLSSATPAVCSISGLSILPVAVGVCTVTASQAGDATYGPATPITRTFSILPIAQTVTFAQPDTQALGSALLLVTPTTDAAGLTPTLTSGTPPVCTVTGFGVSLLAAGVCTLTASSAGDATRSAATSVTRSFHILAVTTAALPAGTAGAPYSHTLVVAGAAGGGIWSAMGTLPAGLTLDPTTGVLSGTVTQAFSGSIPFLYTEGGAVTGVILPLTFAAAAPAPVAPVPPAAAPAAVSPPSSPVADLLASTGWDPLPSALLALLLLVLGGGGLAAARMARRRAGSGD